MKFTRRLFDTMIMPLLDLRPLCWVAVIVSVLYLLDPEGLSILRVILYTVLFWVLSLSIRKAMMPYCRETEGGQRVPMKLSHFLRLAAEGNVAASVVVVGVLVLQAMIALSFIVWLR